MARSGRSNGKAPGAGGRGCLKGMVFISNSCCLQEVTHHLVDILHERPPLFFQGLETVFEGGPGKTSNVQQLATQIKLRRFGSLVPGNP